MDTILDPWFSYLTCDFQAFYQDVKVNGVNCVLKAPKRSSSATCEIQPWAADSDMLLTTSTSAVSVFSNSGLELVQIICQCPLTVWMKTTPLLRTNRSGLASLTYLTVCVLSIYKYYMDFHLYRDDIQSKFASLLFFFFFFRCLWNSFNS